jgi:uncharacterized protein with HEPN domain
MVAAKNPLVRLRHIRDELDALAAATKGYSRERYVADYVVRRASERALLIISEAVKSLPKDLLVRYPEMAWPEIANLGNVLRHEYHMVDDETVWEILSRDLPELSPVIDRMISDLMQP